MDTTVVSFLSGVALAIVGLAINEAVSFQIRAYRLRKLIVIDAESTVAGLVANLACMLFYLIGPFMVPGMSIKEPYIALGVVAAWGIYGTIYFIRRSTKLGKPMLLTTRPA